MDLNIIFTVREHERMSLPLRGRMKDLNFTEFNSFMAPQPTSYYPPQLLHLERMIAFLARPSRFSHSPLGLNYKSWSENAAFSFHQSNLGKRKKSNTTKHII